VADEIIGAVKALETRLSGITGVNYLGQVEINDVITVDSCPAVTLKLDNVGKFDFEHMPESATVELGFLVRLAELGSMGEYFASDPSKPTVFDRGSMALYQKIISAIFGGSTGDTNAAGAWKIPPVIRNTKYNRNAPNGYIIQELEVTVTTGIFDVPTLVP